MKARKHKKNTGGNADNLKPFTAETARAAGRKGGLASGAARREQRTLKEYALALRDTPLNGKPDLTQGGAAVAAMFKQAQRGNVSAFNAIADLLGENEQRNAVVVVPTIVDDIPEDAPMLESSSCMLDIPTGGN